MQSPKDYNVYLANSDFFRLHNLWERSREAHELLFDNYAFLSLFVQHLFFDGLPKPHDYTIHFLRLMANHHYVTMNNIPARVVIACFRDSEVPKIYPYPIVEYPTEFQSDIASDFMPSEGKEE